MSDLTRRRMEALSVEWEASDESRTAFARRHGVTVSKWDYWRRRVRQPRGGDRRAGALSPVHVVSDEDEPEARAIEVTLRSGERLTIPHGVSAELLRTVVSALRAPC